MIVTLVLYRFKVSLKFLKLYTEQQEKQKSPIEFEILEEIR